MLSKILEKEKLMIESRPVVVRGQRWENGFIKKRQEGTSGMREMFSILIAVDCIHLLKLIELYIKISKFYCIQLYLNKVDLKSKISNKISNGNVNKWKFSYTAGGEVYELVQQLGSNLAPSRKVGDEPSSGYSYSTLRIFF